MDNPSLVQQGVDAYKAGNKEEAVRLLSEAIRLNPQEETAWLYLGAAIDDPVRKHQAFERVLAINPDNERAKNALARLNAPAGSAVTGATIGTSMPPKPKAGEGFAVPFEVDGAPATLTIPYIMDTARLRVQQAVDIYTNRNFEQIISSGANATQWDSVFIAGIGVAAVAITTFVGGEIGWLLGGFFGGFGGIITPIIAAIIAGAGTAAGFAGAIYASRAYLQGQNVNVTLPQHSMYYAMIWLPLTLVSAIGTFFLSAVAHSLLLAIVFACLSPIYLIVAIVLGIYGIWLLKVSFDRIYGTENNRGLITAVIAILGGGIARWLVTTVIGGIFNIPFYTIY